MDELKGLYFEWLRDFVIDVYSDGQTYDDLLWHLLRKDYRFTIWLDETRGKDGLHLRKDFLEEYSGFDDYIIDEFLNEPCSVLEMMIALSIRIHNEKFEEEDQEIYTICVIFWEMIDNLGLKYQADRCYHPEYVEMIMETFLNHEYSYDGTGGLFKVIDPPVEVYDIDIWRQADWHFWQVWFGPDSRVRYSGEKPVKYADYLKRKKK